MRGLRALRDLIVVDVARASRRLDDALRIFVEELVALHVIDALRVDVHARKEAERVVAGLLHVRTLLPEPIGIFDRPAERRDDAYRLARHHAEPRILLELRV